jgi:hypothetical protein
VIQKLWADRKDEDHYYYYSSSFRRSNVVTPDKFKREICRFAKMFDGYSYVFPGVKC